MSDRSNHSTRDVAALMAALFVLASIVGCGRGPTAPGAVGTGRLAGAPDRADADEPSASAVVVQMRTGVDGSEIASAFGSVLLGEIPEVRLGLLQVPAGSGAASFARRLQGDARLVFAEPDFLLQTAEGRQSAMAFCEAVRSWTDVADQSALERVGAREARAHASGQGVLVAVLDTGVDLDHPALAAGLALPGIEFGPAPLPGDDRAEGLDTNGDGIVDGGRGHGTHVAGIVLALAPGARVLPVRVLDSDGVGRAFGVARGLVAATTRGAAVVNLSLGLASPSRALAAAVEWARARGTLVVAPTGNDGGDRIDHPAGVPAAIAVAGTDGFDRRVAFSNAGEGTDLAAPAVGILSAFPDGRYARWSGTSMAAPFVAGTLALLLERAGASPADVTARVEAALLAGASSLAATDPANAAILGSGRVSATGALAAFGTHAAEPAERRRSPVPAP